MFKKFLVAMGVIFIGLVASCTLVAGLAGFSAMSDAPKNKAIAEAVTRDLARSWNAGDLKPYFATHAANQLNFADAHMSINKLKPLGALKKIEQAEQTAFHYGKNLGEEMTKTATIRMVAEFENGRAIVVVELKSEAGEMKLWHVNVEPIGEVRAKAQSA
jgi:hypothetical protein